MTRRRQKKATATGVPLDSTISHPIAPSSAASTSASAVGLPSSSSSGPSSSSRSSPPSATSSPSPPPSPSSSLSASVEEVALRACPAAVVRALLSMYSASVTYWLLSDQQCAAFHDEVRSSLPMPEWAVEGAIAASFEEGEDEGDDKAADGGEQADCGNGTAATVRPGHDRQSVSELDFIATIMSTTSQRILWFAGSDHTLFGVYHYHYHHRTHSFNGPSFPSPSLSPSSVVMWPFTEMPQISILAASLPAFTRGVNTDHGPPNTLNHKQRSATARWIQTTCNTHKHTEQQHQQATHTTMGPEGEEGHDGRSNDDDGDADRQGEQVEEEEEEEEVVVDMVDWFERCVRGVMKRTRQMQPGDESDVKRQRTE